VAVQAKNTATVSESISRGYPITNANIDVGFGFGSFFKRVSWFRGAGEAAREFCHRVGMHRVTLERWKRDERPRLIDALKELAKRLDVDIGCLVCGQGHHVTVYANGTKFWSIPRFQEGYYFID